MLIMRFLAWSPTKNTVQDRRQIFQVHLQPQVVLVRFGYLNNIRKSSFHKLLSAKTTLVNTLTAHLAAVKTVWLQVVSQGKYRQHPEQNTLDYHLKITKSLSKFAVGVSFKVLNVSK